MLDGDGGKSISYFERYDENTAERFAENCVVYN